MSEAFERERQNNARLEELSSKVSALRGVTIDIYDSARAHEVIDSTVCRPLFMDWDSSLNPLHSLVADTAELTHSVVRDLLINGVAAQRLRQPTRAHGCVREQGGRAEALGHYNRHFHRAILPAEIVLLEQTGGIC